jgi:hypothetical protein
MGRLHEDTATVAGIWFAATTTAMVEVYQYGERLMHNLVRFSPFNVYNETYTTGISLELWIIETLLRWEPKKFH